MKLCCCCNIAPILIRLNQKYLEFQLIHLSTMARWYVFHLVFGTIWQINLIREIDWSSTYSHSRGVAFMRDRRNTEVKQCFVRTWIGRRASKTYTSYQTQTWKRVHDIIVRWVSMMLVKDLQYTINCPSPTTTARRRMKMRIAEKQQLQQAAGGGVREAGEARAAAASKIRTV